MARYSVAVVGATGLVGQQLLEILQERRFPAGSIRMLASGKSAGRVIGFAGEEIQVEELSISAFKGIDLAFFAVGTDLSREFVPHAVSAGAVVVDKSNAFRLDPAVPLVVPEVNSHALRDHAGIVASPNCSTIQMVVAVKPIHDFAHVERIVVSTYQSVSGTGRDAINELARQTKAALEGEPVSPSVYPHQIAFNMLPHIDSFDESGNTLEETKMVWETRKIFEDEGLHVTATTVRVPVFIGHSESVMLETKDHINADTAKRLLAEAPGVILMDDPQSLKYPMPVDCVGKDEVFVGRIRNDLFRDNCVSMWVVSDNLRKGAATNATQIAEALIRDGLI